jgi:pyrroline-5-carboxylate reductase
MIRNHGEKMSKNPVISFIGAGNMASSLIGGLIADGWNPDQILISDRSETQREAVRSRYPIHSCENNTNAVESADIIVLAVKPQVLREVAEGIADALKQKQPLVISIAAGVRVSDLSRWLGNYSMIVRTMPNTPSLVQSGATGMFAHNAVDDKQRNLAETVLRAVGLTLWVDNEDLLDAVTALSGSGPAYFFYVMEAMEQAGIELGLPQETARLLTLQTAFGAAKMALESSESPAVLRERVTSPGGTTERALSILSDGNLSGLFSKALKGARDRSQELAKILGEDK